MKSDNIYIDALRYGVANMATGISLNELKRHLTSIGWQISDSFENYINYWFFSNFYLEHTYTAIKNGDQTSISFIMRDQVKAWGDFKCIITAEAYDTLQDFEKLKQAKEDTQKAQRLANIAIWISGGMALIQIVLQLISMGCGK